MKKTAFTLTEVLITLGIIGVVAALVMPSLLQNINEAHIGTALARAAEQIETGCSAMIAKANSDSTSVYTTLGDINLSAVPHSGDASDSDSLAEHIADAGYTYLNMTLLPDDEKGTAQKSVKKYDGTDISSSDGTEISDAVILKSNKQQATIYFYTPSISDYSDEDETIAKVYIDANGYKKSPNALGKDIFAFELKNNGKLMPYGLDDEDSYKDNCTDSNITDGKACAARVVADGWEIKY